MIEIVRKVSKQELIDQLYDIDINDKKLYDEINSKNYIGIFQFNGTTANELVEMIHPDDFEEMVSINSLARPGTSSFASQYLYNKEHPGHSTYPSQVSTLLGKTYNTILYQEQVMSIFNKIGGFSLEKTNQVRAVMKRLGKADKKQKDIDEWNRMVDEFVGGAVTFGISNGEARKIADELLQLSAYSFNRSHAVAYTYNAIMTLYLSVYFRPYYYSSVLTYEVDKKKNLLEALQSVKSHGFTILPPDINKSKFHFSPVDTSTIIYGLNDIKFVGEEPAKKIIEMAPYSSILDFLLKAVKNGINKRVVFALVSSGCFDSLDNNRKKVLHIISNFYEKKGTSKVQEKLILLYTSLEKEASGLGIKTDYKDLVLFEKDFLEFNFFYSVFDPELTEKLLLLNKKGLIEVHLDDITSSVKVPVYLKQVRQFIDKNDNQMAFIEIEDMYGFSVSTPIFASYYKSVGELLVPDNIYLMNFYKNKEGNIMFGTSGWVDNDMRKKRMVKKIER